VGALVCPKSLCHLPDGKQRESDQGLSVSRTSASPRTLCSLRARCLPAPPSACAGDGRHDVGRGCLALMVSVCVPEARPALAVRSWLLASKTPADQTHRHLLEKISRAGSSQRAAVIFLGDGESRRLWPGSEEGGWCCLPHGQERLNWRKLLCWLPFVCGPVSVWGRASALRVSDTSSPRRAWGPVLALAAWEKGLARAAVSVTTWRRRPLFWYKKARETLFPM